MKKTWSVVEKIFGGIGGALVGLITGVVIAMNTEGGLSIPLSADNVNVIMIAVAVFLVLGVIFSNIAAKIMDLFFDIG